MEDNKQQARKEAFKPTRLLKQLTKREEYATQLRKKKKEEIFSQKRKLPISESNKLSIPVSDTETFNEERINAIASTLKNLKSTDPEILAVLQELRVLLSVKSDTPVEITVKLGLVPILSKLLDKSLEDPIFLESSRILGNIAATTHENVELLMKQNVHLKWVDSLSKTMNTKVQDQSLWGLCNIAGDSVQGRDELLKTELPEQILKLVSNGPIPTYLLERTAWAMANLCKWDPPPPFEKIKAFIPYMGKMLSIKNDEVLTHTLWGLSYITDRQAEPLKQLIEPINLKLVSQLVTHKNWEISAAALRILGNVCSGSVKDVELVIASEGLPALAHIVMFGNHPNLLKEACWVLSNIAAGPPHHVEAILGFISKLSALTIESSKFPVQNEAGWTLANAFAEATSYQLAQMMDQGALEAIVHLLDISDPQLTMALLGAIDVALNLDDRLQGQVTELFEQFGGVTKLEGLQTHQNAEIYKKVVRIMEKHYALEEYGKTEDNYAE